MNCISSFVLFLSILSVSLNVVAEKIYKTTDESGNAVFSDKETPDAKKIKVQPNVVDVNIPDMPEPYVREKTERSSQTTSSENQQDPQGRGVATGGNLKRKIRNVTNGEGIDRPGNLPSRPGRPGIGGGGGRGGGGR